MIKQFLILANKLVSPPKLASMRIKPDTLINSTLPYPKPTPPG